MSSVSSGQKDSSSSQPYPAPVTEINEDERNLYPNFQGSVEGEEEKREIQPPVDSLDDDGWPNMDPNFMMNSSRNSRKERRHKLNISSGPMEISFTPDDVGGVDGHGAMRQQSSPTDRAHQRSPKLSSSPSDLQFVPDWEEHGVPMKQPRKHLPAHLRQNGSAVPSSPSPGRKRTSHERQLSPPWMFHSPTHPVQGLPSDL